MSSFRPGYLVMTLLALAFLTNCTSSTPVVPDLGNRLPADTSDPGPECKRFFLCKGSMTYWEDDNPPIDYLNLIGGVIIDDTDCGSDESTVSVRFGFLGHPEWNLTLPGNKFKNPGDTEDITYYEGGISMVACGETHSYQIDDSFELEVFPSESDLGPWPSAWKIDGFVQRYRQDWWLLPDGGTLYEEKTWLMDLSGREIHLSSDPVPYP